MPRFSKHSIKHVKALYPEIGSTETISSYNTTYERAQLIYRDVVLACPAYWMAGAAHKKSYVGEYIITPAKHASDTTWVSYALLSFLVPILQSPFLNQNLTNHTVESSQPDSKNQHNNLRRFCRSLCFLLPDRRSQRPQTNRRNPARRTRILVHGEGICD